MALEIQRLKAKLDLESNYFAYYWDKFHNLITFGFPFYYKFICNLTLNVMKNDTW